MKRIKKKIIIILLIIITISSMSRIVEARSIWDIAGAFIDSGKDIVGTTQEGKQGLENFGFLKYILDYKHNFIELIDFLWGIGLLVIFITTVVLGMQYMLVLPNERSRIKQSTTPYIIGVIIIFGSLTIWRFIIIVLDGLILKNN